MDQPADLVLTGGPVLTPQGVVPDAGVAVRGSRIVAVGPAGSGVLDGWVGPRTEVVPLAGRLLVPGLQDAHVHPVWGGRDAFRCDLSGARTRHEVLAALGAYGRVHPVDGPRGPWVLGSGWSMTAFPGGTPRAADLDAVVGDRPAFLPNRDGHGAWVTTRALRLAGIDSSTPDPPDGRIERDPDGTPTGMLHEGAMALVGRLLPVPSEDDVLAALLVGQERLHSVGVTAWQDAIVGEYADAPDPGPAYARAAREGLLTGRVVGALWWDRAWTVAEVPDRVAELSARRDALTGGRFRATSVKVMQDGVVENGSAAMLEPYLRDGRPTASSGLSFVDPELLAVAVPALDAAGFDVHFHAIGDRAVRECLDAVQRAREVDGPSRGRHHIAHLQVVHPDDVPRFAALGVTATIQALWAVLSDQMVDLTLPVLGLERSRRQYPFGDLHRAGARLAAGSDWSVSTQDPWPALHAAVLRTAHPDHDEDAAPDGPHEPRAPFLPEQALDLSTALSAYTSGSAYVNHLDDTGALRVGALADLAVLDRDPFAGPADEIGSTRTVATFVGGARVWGAPDA